MRFSLILLFSLSELFASSALPCLLRVSASETKNSTLLEMDGFFKDEHFKNLAQNDNKLVYYLNEQQRAERSVGLSDSGKLVDRLGKLVNKTLNPFARPKHYLFAVSEEGKMVLVNFDDFPVPADHILRHSSIFAGENVKYAGNVFVKNGKIVKVDNLSGHYKPSAENLVIFIENLQNSGVDVSALRVEFQQTEVGTDIFARLEEMGISKQSVQLTLPELPWSI